MALLVTVRVLIFTLSEMGSHWKFLATIPAPPATHSQPWATHFSSPGTQLPQGWDNTSFLPTSGGPWGEQAREQAR